MITINELHLYEKNPRALLNRSQNGPTRTIKEELLSYLLLNKEGAKTRYMPVVNAPADPTITKFMRMYAERVSDFLIEDGDITDDEIESCQNAAYKMIKSSASLKTLIKQAENYPEYASYLLLKNSRIGVDSKIFNEVRELADQLESCKESLNLVLEEMELVRGGLFEKSTINPFKSLGFFDYNKDGTNRVRLLNKTFNLSIPKSFVLRGPLDYCLYDPNSKALTLLNVKTIDCSVKEIKEKADDLLWIDVGFLKGVSNMVLRHLAYKPTIFIKILAIDPNGYRACLSASIETQNRLYEKLHSFARKPEVIKGIKEKDFSTYLDFPSTINI